MPIGTTNRTQDVFRTEHILGRLRNFPSACCGMEIALTIPQSRFGFVNRVQPFASPEAKGCTRAVGCSWAASTSKDGTRLGAVNPCDNRLLHMQQTVVQSAGCPCYLFFRRCAFVLAVVLLSCLSLAANDLAVAFDQANKLYERGKYAEAAEAYTTLVKGGRTSAALYFNLGNALLKSGELGHAILNYRLAQRLAPRDPDIRANLRFARAAASTHAPGSPRWFAWPQMFSLNELTALSFIAFWACFVLLAWCQLQPKKNPALRKPILVCSLLAGIFGIWLAALWRAQVGSRPAVVVSKEAVVRLGPFAESQSAFVLRDGAEIKISDVKMDWLQIRDAAGRTGWLRQENVVPLVPVRTG